MDFFRFYKKKFSIFLTQLAATLNELQTLLLSLGGRHILGLTFKQCIRVYHVTLSTNLGREGYLSACAELQQTIKFKQIGLSP